MTTLFSTEYARTGTTVPASPALERGIKWSRGHAACNRGAYAKTLAAHIEPRLVDLDDGSRTDVGCLVADGEVDVKLDDVQGQRDDERATQADDAREWLDDELADGEWHASRDIKAAAQAAGIASRTLQRASVALGVTVEKRGFPPRSSWRLPVRANPVGANGEPDPWRECANDAAEPNPDASSSNGATSPGRGANGADGLVDERPAGALDDPEGSAA